MQVPGMCIVVMVVVVIRVVVVSSSMGSKDMPFLGPVWLEADTELRAVVSSPGDMTVAADSVCPSPGTACVGFVVVPAESVHSMRVTSNEHCPHCVVAVSPKPQKPVLAYLCLQKLVLSTPYSAGRHGSGPPVG